MNFTNLGDIIHAANSLVSGYYFKEEVQQTVFVEELDGYYLVFLNFDKDELTRVPFHVLETGVNGNYTAIESFIVEKKIEQDTLKRDRLIKEKEQVEKMEREWYDRLKAKFEPKSEKAKQQVFLGGHIIGVLFDSLPEDQKQPLNKWLYGQTVTGTEDGKTIVYWDDYSRWYDSWVKGKEARIFD